MWCDSPFKHVIALGALYSISVRAAAQVQIFLHIKQQFANCIYITVNLLDCTYELKQQISSSLKILIEGCTTHTGLSTDNLILITWINAHGLIHVD